MESSGGRRDFPTVLIDRVCTRDDIARNAQIMMPVAIQSFAEMVAESVFLGEENGSCECMSLGMSRRESANLILRDLARHLQSSPKGDLDQLTVRVYVAVKLRRTIIAAWGASHHRN